MTNKHAIENARLLTLIADLQIDIIRSSRRAETAEADVKRLLEKLDIVTRCKDLGDSQVVNLQLALQRALEGKP